MSRKQVRELTSFLGANGYDYIRTNSKGFEVWKRRKEGADGQHHMVNVYDGLTDKKVKNLIHTISRDLGIDSPRDGRKRRPDAIKARHAAGRERAEQEVNRAKAELAALRDRKDADIEHARAVRAERDESLDGLGANLTHDEQLAVARQIEEVEREVRFWQRQLSGVDVDNAIRHRS